VRAIHLVSNSTHFLREALVLFFLALTLDPFFLREALVLFFLVLTLDPLLDLTFDPPLVFFTIRFQRFTPVFVWVTDHILPSPPFRRVSTEKLVALAVGLGRVLVCPRWPRRAPPVTLSSQPQPPTSSIAQSTRELSMPAVKSRAKLYWGPLGATGGFLLQAAQHGVHPENNLWLVVCQRHATCQRGTTYATSQTSKIGLETHGDRGYGSYSTAV
jgi:hypothetical protein